MIVFIKGIEILKIVVADYVVCMTQMDIIGLDWLEGIVRIHIYQSLFGNIGIIIKRPFPLIGFRQAGKTGIICHTLGNQINIRIAVAVLLGYIFKRKHIFIQ